MRDEGDGDAEPESEARGDSVNVAAIDNDALDDCDVKASCDALTEGELTDDSVAHGVNESEALVVALPEVEVEAHGLADCDSDKALEADARCDADDDSVDDLQ